MDDPLLFQHGVIIEVVVIVDAAGQCRFYEAGLFPFAAQVLLGQKLLPRARGEEEGRGARGLQAGMFLLEQEALRLDRQRGDVGDLLGEIAERATVLG